MPKFLLEASYTAEGIRGIQSAGRNSRLFPRAKVLTRSRRLSAAAETRSLFPIMPSGGPSAIRCKVELGLGQRLAVRHGQALPRAARRRNLEPRPLISPDYGYLSEATGGLPVDSSGSPNIHEGVKAISAREDRPPLLVRASSSSGSSARCAWSAWSASCAPRPQRAPQRQARRDRLRKQIAEVDRKIKARCRPSRRA